MKKLGQINPDIENWDLLLLACGKIDDLIDLVNSQQEAIERLQDHVDHEARHVSEPADDKPEYKLPGTEEVIEKLDKATLRPNLVDSIPSDTHRTVTLRVPKGMRIGEALSLAYRKSGNDYVTASKWLYLSSDTDLQKALDEVEHE